MERCTTAIREPWNKGKLVGQKAPLKLKEIWAIRARLQLANRRRELALFNLASTASFEPATWSSCAYVTSATGAAWHLGPSCCSRRPNVRYSLRLRSRPVRRSALGSATRV
jgi:hypothetical protein